MKACSLIIPSGSLSLFFNKFVFEDLLMRCFATNDVTPIDFKSVKKILRVKGVRWVHRDTQ